MDASIDREERLPISESGLIWRWTSPAHAVFPAEDLHSMACLRKERARELNQVTTDDEVWETRDELSDLRDEEQVFEWLENRLASGGEVVVIWGEDEAVAVPSALFTKRWDDFCYPSADDVAIVPADLSWRVQYWHWEAFDFGVRRREIG